MSDLSEAVSDIEGIELFLDGKDTRGYEFNEGTDWEDVMYKTECDNNIYDD